MTEPLAWWQQPEAQKQRENGQSDVVQTLVHIREGGNTNEKESQTCGPDVTEVFTECRPCARLWAHTQIPHAVFLHLSWKGEYALPL